MASHRYLSVCSRVLTPNWILVVATAVLLTACATPRTPAQQLSHLESALLDSRSLHVEFQVSARGAFQADISGTLSLQDTEATLSASGSFGADPVALSLQTSHGRLTGGNGDNQFDLAQPAALREALLIGLTRMGILHNLARLTALQPPDQATGGVQEWVQAQNLDANANRLRFDIVVAGQPSGHAVLTVDDNGVLQGREQVVTFPGGSMQVSEIYTIRLGQ